MNFEWVAIKTQRQVRILTQGEDTLIIDFCELKGHKFVSQYYIIANNHELSTVSMLGAMMAWIDYDADSFNHPHLMISEDDM